MAEQTRVILRFMMVYTFLLASFKDGFGPLVSVYLVVSKGWSPGTAGIIWFARDFSALIFSSFVGVIIDKLEHKRILLVGATAISALASTCIVWTQNFAILCTTSFIAGAAISFIQPAKTAMVLGLVSKETFDESAKLVEICDHLGSLVIIGIAGIIGYFSWPDKLENIFYIIGVGGFVSAIILLFMPLKRSPDTDEENIEDDGINSDRRSVLDSMRRSLHDLTEESCIDHASSRNLRQGENPVSRLSMALENKDLRLYAGSSFFFHLGNAAILPLLSQVIALDSGRAGIPFTCGNVGIAQLLSIFATVAMGKSISSGHGYKVSVIAGYIIGVPLRCAVILVLIKYQQNPYALMATQVLDGVGAGTFGLSVPIYLKHLTAGTGHFAFTIGLLGSVTMTAAALSNLLSGLIVEFTSYSIGFGFLGSSGLIAVVLLYFVNINPADEHADEDKIFEVDAAEGVLTEHTTEERW